MIFKNPPLRDTNVPGPFSQIAAQEFNNTFIQGMKYCFECLEKNLMENPTKVEEILEKAKKELF
jgi:hypothetical protein